jgi:TolC family type I secretion outer membrane protein
MRHLLTAAAVIALLPVAADAATLTEALAAAYNNNPTILAQRARLRATDEQVPQALSGWRPTVQATGDLGLQWSNSTSGSTASALGGGTGSIDRGSVPRSVGLSVNQPVYSGGRTVAATARAENLIRAERARTVAVEQQVFTDTVTFYLDTLRDQAVLELSINNEQVLRRQLEASNDRFRVGEITRTDVAQSESRLARGISDRIAAENNLEISRTNYERVVGEPPGRLTVPAERPALPISKQEASSMAAGNNPNIITAQFVEAAAREAVRQVRGELLPDLRIVGSVNRAEDSGRSGTVQDSASLSARVTVPLYESGSVYSRTREAQQTVGQRRSELDDVRRQVVQAANTAWENLQSSRARVESLRSTIRAAEIALDGVTQEAAVGSRTVLDILNAEQELFTARVDLVRAQRDQLVNEYQLTAAVGRLTAADLNLPVQLYDVDQHYKTVRDKWIGFEGGEEANR